jgi:hypothetical protein
MLILRNNLKDNKRMKKLFTFLLIALVAISVNAAGVMICGKAYNENSYQLINQELTEAITIPLFLK